MNSLIDLARIAPLPTDQKHRALERFKLGHPTITCKPVRVQFAGIFNVQPDMFTAPDPTARPSGDRPRIGSSGFAILQKLHGPPAGRGNIVLDRGCDGLGVA